MILHNIFNRKILKNDQHENFVYSPICPILQKKLYFCCARNNRVKNLFFLDNLFFKNFWNRKSRSLKHFWVLFSLNGSASSSENKFVCYLIFQSHTKIFGQFSYSHLKFKFEQNAAYLSTCYDLKSCLEFTCLQIWFQNLKIFSRFWDISSFLKPIFQPKYLNKKT
jgi:hypothetical protein